MNRQITGLIHPDGWKFIAIFAGIAMLLSFLSCSLGWVGFILTVWCVYFFRCPPRVVPEREGLVVSPADGKVVLIQKVTPAPQYGLGDGERTRISIFLNVFDVHVNRMPFPGIVEKVIYHQGQFLNASLDKASELNERNTVVLRINGGERTIGVTQIAGLIARRIRCDVQPEESVGAGQVYGLIRFGSRVDVYLPEGVEPMVIVGQRTIAGETVLADLQSNEPAREGICI